jgi:uncharacterized protein YjbI with pentapeptide repeats
MANPEHLAILQQGVEVWNKWREENPALRPDLRKAYLRKINICNANLREVDLTKANLSKANLAGAIISEAILYKSFLVEANIIGSDISSSDLRAVNLNKAQLQNTDLRRANLNEADLSGANLSGADLRKVNLGEANLNRAILKESDISGGILYGTARAEWKIDKIKCEYVFWDKKGHKRFPNKRDFNTGEFEELYKHVPTIEYFFEHGFTPIDAVIMDRVVKAINEKHPEFELKLDSFHSRGQPHAVFTIFHKDVAEEALYQIKAGYEARLAKLEGERDAYEKCFNRVIEKPQIYIEYLKNFEEANTYIITWNQVSQKIDLSTLTEQLSELRQALKGRAKSLKQDSTVGEIANAEAAAKNGDGPKVLKHLKKAGVWSLKVAQDIGTKVAADVIKKSLGL